jgi:hypothetical protein
MYACAIRASRGYSKAHKIIITCVCILYKLTEKTIPRIGLLWLRLLKEESRCNVLGLVFF